MEYNLSNSKDIFESFWKIYPFGSRDVTHINYVNTLNQHPDITSEMLGEKYRDYLDYLKQFQNGKYTKKQFTIQEPQEWLVKKSFLSETRREADPLEFYLYGLPL